MVSSLASVKTWPSRNSAISVLEVKASWKRQRIHLDSLVSSIPLRRQLMFTICCRMEIMAADRSVWILEERMK